MKFNMLPQPVGLLKLMQKWFAQVQGRELCSHKFLKYMFDIVMCQDTCIQMCVKLGMILNSTKFYSLIPEWMTLMCTQGHRVTGKLELVQSFCGKDAWSNSNVCDVDYVIKMTVTKSCKHGKYWTFEHLLFLFDNFQ